MRRIIEYAQHTKNSFEQLLCTQGTHVLEEFKVKQIAEGKKLNN